MLPTIEQYKKWSLPSKYAFWGFLVAVVPILFLVKDWLLAVPDYAVLAFNYGTSEMTIYGAAGDTTETAVIIRGANSHEAGITGEHYWIRRRYPGYKPMSQAVFEEPERDAASARFIVRDAETGVEFEMPPLPSLPRRRYDVVQIRNWYGRTHEVFFDITSFWGKPAEPLPGGIDMGDIGRQMYELREEAINRAKAKQRELGNKKHE